MKINLLYVNLLILFCILDLTAQKKYYVKLDAVGSKSGLNWSNAFTSLDSALKISSTNDTIWIANGVYLPTMKSGGVDEINRSFTINKSIHLFGGFKGFELHLNQRDSNNGFTILSGDIDKNDLNSDSNFIDESFRNIKGFNAIHIITITNILGSLTVDNIIITGGSSNKNGGGIIIQLSGLQYQENIEIKNCQFYGNYANYNGASLYAEVYSKGECNLNIFNCKFNGNNSEMNGGCIYSTNHNGYLTLNITGCNFVKNSANKGGAIFNDFWDGLSDFTLSNSIFENNENVGVESGDLFTSCDFGSTANFLVEKTDFINSIGHGMLFDIGVTGNLSGSVKSSKFINNSKGGIYYSIDNSSFSQFKILECQFKGNRGVGLRNVSDFQDLNILVSRCVFENNVGAIFNSSNGNGLINPLIANCLFVNNQADEGGGISNIIYRGALNTSVLNCTFFGNTCTSNISSPNVLHGSALFTYDLPGNSVIKVSNCIFWNNFHFDSLRTVSHDLGGFNRYKYSVDYSLLKTAGVNWKGVIVNKNTVFKDPINGDFRLASSSPCIDKGNNDSLGKQDSIDLDGKSRKFNSTNTPESIVDMGCYEYNEKITINNYILGDLDKYQIFPNPFSNELTIKLSQNDEFNKVEYDLIFSNIYNQKILKKTLSNEMLRMDVSNWPAGTYFLQILKAGQIIGSQVLIKS